MHPSPEAERRALQVALKIAKRVIAEQRAAEQKGARPPKEPRK